MRDVCPSLTVSLVSRKSFSLFSPRLHQSRRASGGPSHAIDNYLSGKRRDSDIGNKSRGWKRDAASFSLRGNKESESESSSASPPSLDMRLMI